jgi:hypothetical protein
MRSSIPCDCLSRFATPVVRFLTQTKPGQNFRLSGCETFGIIVSDVIDPTAHETNRISR